MEHSFLLVNIKKKEKPIQIVKLTILFDSLKHRFSVQKMSPVLLFCRQVLVNNKVPMHFL